MTENDVSVFERVKKRFAKRPEQRENPRTEAERARQMVALSEAMDESEHVARFIEAAQAVKDADLLAAPEPETPTAEQIAAMNGEELDVLARVAGASQRISPSTQELKGKIANLESAEGWEIADDLADAASAVVESRERTAERWRACLGLVKAELQERRRAAEKEARKRRYLEEHQGEMLEAMLTGNEERINELRAALSDPPGIAEPEPSNVQTWSGYESNAVFGEGDAEG